jgi:hypothetical protein
MTKQANQKGVRCLKRGRSRTTNRPTAIRKPGSDRSRHRRERDLFVAFASKLDPADIVGAAVALRCAELTAATETLRRQIMDADLSQADDAKLAVQAKLAEQLIRLENLLDRCERRLARLTEGKSDGPSLADIIREDQQQERQK